tara:strand:+ start:3112 stop:4206 length:1095 start_codon:yes stop_codon:yes gene_type:complete
MAKKIIVVLVILLISSGESKAQNNSIGTDLIEEELIQFLRESFYPTTPKRYDAARDIMYDYLDVDESDSLTGVYTGLRAKKDGTRTPSNGSLSFNTEHSWPQSFYDSSEPMRGDIHHLFPVWSSPNSSRGNHPYAEINDNLTTSWWYWKNGSSVASLPNSNVNEYSEYYNSTFEPREDHKGNAARAMFYFWTMYQSNTDIIQDEFDNEAFFDVMKNTLFAWHKLDPADDHEIARSIAVEEVQGNKNPFIHDSSLVRRAYFYVEPSQVNNEFIAGSIKKISLKQNYPNPFNPSTRISFDLPTSSKVRLEVFDMLGRQVAVLIQDQIKNSGENSAVWNATGFSSGIYYAVLTTPTSIQSIKMLLLK